MTSTTSLWPIAATRLSARSIETQAQARGARRARGASRAHVAARRCRQPVLGGGRTRAADGRVEQQAEARGRHDARRARRRTYIEGAAREHGDMSRWRDDADESHYLRIAAANGDDYAMFTTCAPAPTSASARRAALARRSTPATASQRHLACVRVLIDIGAGVDLADKRGDTPLPSRRRPTATSTSCGCSTLAPTCGCATTTARTPPTARARTAAASRRAAARRLRRRCRARTRPPRRHARSARVGMGWATWSRRPPPVLTVDDLGVEERRAGDAPHGPRAPPRRASRTGRGRRRRASEREALRTTSTMSCRV